MHYPKADIDRLYLPKSSRGRGMMKLELTYKTSTIGIHQYRVSTQDWILKLVKGHETLQYCTP